MIVRIARNEAGATQRVQCALVPRLLTCAASVD